MKTTRFFFYSILKLTLLLSIVLISSCNKEGCLDPNAINYNPDAKKNNPSDCQYEEFDRAGMLKNISRNYISPGIEAYSKSVDTLVSAKNTFISAVNENNLITLRNSWKNTLMSWQEISFIGPSDYLPEAYIERLNVYPVDTASINDNITLSAFPSVKDQGGYQTLDYLLNMSNNSDVIAFFNDNMFAAEYLSKVVDDISEITNTVKTNWYTDTTSFINNNANTADGTSISIIANALNKHYEYYIRRGKFGLPLNIYDQYTDAVFPNKVECYYYGQSLPFAKKAVESVKNFLNGCEFRNSEVNGLGFDDYADLVNAQYGSTSLSTAINDQFDVALSTIDQLQDPLSDQLSSNRAGVQGVYDNLQQLVILIKNDLTSSALGIQITYADNDGD